LNIRSDGAGTAVTATLPFRDAAQQQRKSEIA